ncbi:MAG TPA: hypothetical protein VGN14_14495 [Candidatus Elarobacter sp.]|jgi:hypothetical protein
MQSPPRSRPLPYAWIAAVAAVLIVASIGLAQRPHSAALHTVATGGASASDRAESASLATQLQGGGVDMRRFVERIDVHGETAAVTIDGDAYGGLSPDERTAAFDALAASWSQAYRAHQGGRLDRPIALDFVDGSGEVVHHRQIDPE